MPRPTLTLLSNAALIVSTVALIASISYTAIRSGSTPTASNSVDKSTALQVGDAVPAMRRVGVRVGMPALVIFLSTTCKHCESGVGFYNGLYQESLNADKRVSVIAVFLQSANEVLSFKNRAHLKVESAADVNFHYFGVRSVPTVLLIDKDGRVSRTWLGASAYNEADIAIAFKDALERDQ
jgi:thioredoxin-related protein